MRILHYPFITPKNILALGAESSGNFSIYKNGWIYFSDDFGDLLDSRNYPKYQKILLDLLNKDKIRPDVILCDLHPDFKTTALAKKLARKYKAELIQVQHHVAHIFSAFGEDKAKNNAKGKNFVGIAMDGTGYGTDGKIWGGEVIEVKSQKLVSSSTSRSGSKVEKLDIHRIGHLENQVMIGGDLAIRQPARMLVGILAKFLEKEKIFELVKRFYTQKEFNLLYSQLRENFNCVETSSTGRVLDATSVLLGFSKNERKYKHEAALELEKNSSLPFEDIPISISTRNELLTVPLFQFLIKNLDKDKERLAATAQFYLAEGLSRIALKNSQGFPIYPHTKKESAYNFGVGVYYAGGMTEGKIISGYFKKQGFKGNEIIPKGDAGISFGQLMYFLNTL